MRTIVAATAALLLGAVPAAASELKPPTPAGEPANCFPSDLVSRNEIIVRREIHVVVCFNVAPDGTVKDATIAKSGGGEMLDQYALRCVSDLRYNPATKDGQPIEFPLVTQMNWCAGANPMHMRKCPSPPVAAKYKEFCAKALNASEETSPPKIKE